jgi:hypothetical protein
MKSKVVERGDRVRDEVTGFEGIVICRSVWLNGCVRFVVQAEHVGKDGVPIPCETIDAQQTKLIKKGVVTAGPDLAEPELGGPRTAPQRHAAPTR